MYGLVHLTGVERTEFLSGTLGTRYSPRSERGRQGSEPAFWVGSSLNLTEESCNYRAALSETGLTACLAVGFSGLGGPLGGRVSGWCHWNELSTGVFSGILVASTVPEPAVGTYSNSLHPHALIYLRPHHPFHPQSAHHPSHLFHGDLPSSVTFGASLSSSLTGNSPVCASCFFSCVCLPISSATRIPSYMMLQEPPPPVCVKPHCRRGWRHVKRLDLLSLLILRHQPVDKSV